MAITQHYRRISREQIETLRSARPDLPVIPLDFPAWLLEPEDDVMLVSLGEAPGFEPLGPDPDPATAEPGWFSLDSHWQALHFLLTGEPEGGPLPLRNAVLGGTPLLEPTEGSPGIRWLSPEEVLEVSEALSGIPRSDLEAVFDPAEFNQAEIYPNAAPERWGWEDLGPLLDCFERLVAYFRETAGLGQGLLVTRG